MVHHFYVINPAHKFRLFFNLIFRGSKSILREVNAPTNVSFTAPETIVVEEIHRPKVNVSDLINPDVAVVTEGGLKRDEVYYKDDSEGGFCTFRVENTLFKVHKCFLVREPSAFVDMLSLPPIPGNYEGTSDESPIPLSDSAEEFQDLLWALYAVPSQLVGASGPESPSFERVLNVAQMANKYGVVSYETWALERMLDLAQTGVFRTAPPDLCAKALNIAALCDYETLVETITRRLIPRILWSDMNLRSIHQVAEDRGLRRILGVIYYKELIDVEKSSAENRRANRHVFPDEWTQEKRDLFLAAHRSLVNLWESICTTPPCFVEFGCVSHSDCLTTWSELWAFAASARETTRHGSADVLGRLKAMMVLLKTSMVQLHPISLECTLAALESITVLRDDITASLMDHFQSS